VDARFLGIGGVERVEQTLEPERPLGACLKTWLLGDPSQGAFGVRSASLDLGGFPVHDCKRNLKRGFLGFFVEIRPKALIAAVLITEGAQFLAS